MIFLIIFLFFQWAPVFEVRLKINKAYKFPRSSEHGRDEAQEMSRDAASKCVRFWKDVYRQPKTGDDLRFDHGFFLRFKNPSDAHHILVYLKFDLVVRMIDRCPPSLYVIPIKSYVIDFFIV